MTVSKKKSEKEPITAFYDINYGTLVEIEMKKDARKNSTKKNEDKKSKEKK